MSRCPNGALINSYPLFLDSLGNRITAEAYYGITVQSGAVNLLPFQGAVTYSSPVATKSDIHIFQGDSVTIPVSIKDATGALMDLSLYTVRLAGKASLGRGVYLIGTGSPLGPRDITADITGLGTVNVNLSTSDTNLVPRLYFLEIQIVKGADVITPWMANLYIDAHVINA